MAKKNHLLHGWINQQEEMRVRQNIFLEHAIY